MGLSREIRDFGGFGRIPTWSPPQRKGTTDWTVSTHYFASYAKRCVPLGTAGTTNNPDPGNLVVVVNCYRPRGHQALAPNSGGLTLALAHSIGAHKETWEPTISHLLQLVKASGSPAYISEIWAIEPVHHGDAAVLNSDADLQVDSLQYPVDIIEFIERRLPPAELPREDHIICLPRHEVVHRPNVIGIGHSIGGTAIVKAALHASTAFSSIILIEPLLSNPMFNVRRAFEIMSSVAAKRKDTFSSQEDIVKHFKKHPLYKAWDPEVVALFSKHGVYVNSSGHLCLKARREHEATLCADRYSYQSTLYSMPSLSSKLPVFFIYGTQSLLIPNWSAALTAKMPPNARSQNVDAGHMIVQEKPLLLATTMHEYLRQFSASQESKIGTGAKL